MYKKIVLFSLFLIAIISSSIANYDFNANCRKAHQAIMSLRLVEAKSILDAEKKASPSNLIPYYLENYSDFISIVVSQDKKEFDRLLNKRSDLISMLEDGDKSSPYYNYCLADAYFQWAVARLIFIKDLSNVFDGIKAAMELKKSYEIIERNQSKFPSFAPNYKLLGLMRALIDVVPENYKKIVQTIAFKGSFDQGIAELTLLTDKAMNDASIGYIKSESLFLLCFIEINLQGDKQKAVFLKKYFNHPQLIAEFKTNAVLLYAKARYEIYFGRNDDAIKTLEDFPRGKEYAYFGFIDYLTGRTKQNRLDKDAIDYFSDYLSKYKGEHYIKTAYQQKAWYYLLNNEVAKYFENMRKAKTLGSSLSETDKQAGYEAGKNEIPNYRLLKARVLCDGGYFQQAVNVLNAENLGLKNAKDSLEYLYRFARIYHEWGKPDNAIPYYETTIRTGDKQPWYFSANAALQLGLIYESRNENNKARLYYNRCLYMDPKEYKNSLHTKAKAGLKRIQ
jgi:hypothetical protein